MHVDGGNLQLLDGDFGRIPLSALVALNFQVSTAAGVVDTFSLEDEIQGNSGVNGHSTFNFKLGGDLRSATHYSLQSDSNNNVVGETGEIDKFDFPVSLSNVPINQQFTLDVTLDGEVFSPGGEVISRASLRDPAHIDDADPLAGAVSIIVGENPVVSVPEPSTTSLLVVALPALLVLLRRRGWSVSRGDMSRLTQALQ